MNKKTKLTGSLEETHNLISNSENFNWENLQLLEISNETIRENANKLKDKDWNYVLQYQNLDKKFIEDFANNLYEVAKGNSYLLEDNEFNGFSDIEGGEINFTELMKNPNQKSAIIDRLFALNQSLVNQRKVEKETKKENNLSENKDSVLTPDNIEERLLKLQKIENKKELDFILYQNEQNEIIYGIEKQEQNIDGKIHSLVVPFFKKNLLNNEFSLVVDQENKIVEKEKLLGSISQNDGLSFWGNLIKKEGQNPDLLISKKTTDFLNDNINNDIINNKFSLKKTWDEALSIHKKLFADIQNEASFEDLYEDIYNKAKNSPSSIKKGITKILDSFEEVNKIKGKKNLEMKFKNLNNLLNQESKVEDEKFINSFSYKFKNNELTDKDILNLIEKYNSSSNPSMAEAIVEFVEIKKQEIAQRNKLSNKIENKDFVTISNKESFHKGIVTKIDDKSVTIEDKIKKTTFTFDINECEIEKMFKGQRFSISEAKKALENNKSNSIKWDDLSFSSKEELLKGNPSELYTAKYINNYDTGYQKVEEKKTKLILNNNKGNAQLQFLFKDEKFDLNQFVIDSNKLSSEQKTTLFKGDILSVGQKQIKYDMDLNRISIKSIKEIFQKSKGINFKNA